MSTTEIALHSGCDDLQSGRIKTPRVAGKTWSYKKSSLLKRMVGIQSHKFARQHVQRLSREQGEFLVYWTFE